MMNNSHSHNNNSRSSYHYSNSDRIRGTNSSSGGNVGSNSNAMSRGYIPRGGRGGGRMMNRSASLSSSSNFTPSSTTNHGGRFSSNNTSSAMDDYTAGSASNPNDEDRVTPSFVRRASSFGDKPRGRGGGYAPPPMTSVTTPNSSNYTTTTSHNSNTTTATTTNDYYTMDGGGSSGGGRSSSGTNIRGRGRGMNHSNNSTMSSSRGGGGGRGRFSSYSSSYGRSSPREDTNNNSSSSSRSYSWNRNNSYSNKFQDWSDNNNNNNNNNNKHQQQYGSSSDDAPSFSSYRPPYRGGYQHYSSNNHHHHHSNNNNSSSRHLDSMKNDRITSDSFTSNTASTSIGIESTYTSSAVDSTEQHPSWNHHHTASSPSNNDNSIKSYHSSINTSGGNRSVDSEKRMLRSMPYSSYDHNTTTAKAFSYASLAESPPPIFGNTNGSTSSTAMTCTNGDVDANSTATTPASVTTTNCYGPRWNTKSSFEQTANYKKHPVHDNEPQDFSSFKWKRMKQEDDYIANNNCYTSGKSNTSSMPNINITNYNSTNMGEASNLDNKTEFIQQQQEQQQPPQQKPIPSHTPPSLSFNPQPEMAPILSSQPTMVASKVESTTPNELILPPSNEVREGTDGAMEKPEVVAVSETNSPSVDQTVGQAILKSEKVQESTQLEQELKGSIITTVGQTKSPPLEKAQETTPSEPVRKATTVPASAPNIAGPMKSEKVQDMITSQVPVRKGTMAFLRYMDALNTLEYTYVKYVLACKQEKKLQLHIQQLEEQPFAT